MDLNVYERAIADAERRVGQFILSGGKETDDYVEKQKEFIKKMYTMLKKSERVN